MSSLPKGWANSELCNITEVVSGNAFKSKDFVENGIPVVKISNVQSGKYIEKNQEYLPDSFVNESNARFIVNHNDLLIALTRPIVSNKLKVCTYPNKKQVGLLNQRVARLDVYEGSSECFLHYYLSSKGFKESVQASMSETLQPNLSPKSLSKIRIDYPPLAEQKRIVEKLDEVLAQVDTIKARLDGIPSLLKRFRQSVLASAVSGKLTSSDNKRGQLSKLGDTGVEIKTGPFGSALHKSDYVEGGISVINPMHINDGKITPATQMSITTEKFESLVAWHLRDGDVVVGRRGEMGRAAVVNEASSKPCLCGTGSMLLRCNDDINPEYLSYIIRSPIAVSYFNATSVGSTMVNLNQKVIKNLEVYFPLLEEQKEIVRLVDQYFTFADTIEAQVKKAQARVNNLTQSILAKAFRGELVPQDPNDEPADKLLERIAQARSEAEALAKATKKAETARKKAEKATAKG